MLFEGFPAKRAYIAFSADFYLILFCWFTPCFWEINFFCFWLNNTFAWLSKDATTFFFATLFLENEAQISKTIYKAMFVMSKQVSLPKISSILQKMKIGSKSDIRPFCRKPFNWVSKEFWDCFGFALLCLVIGYKILRHFFNQSKIKPIVTCSHAFSCAWRWLHVFAMSCD